MSSLYRKYRPTNFNQIVGQDHITSSILASLNAGRVGHAYLFSGPRGTGKTTLARLLAKQVNCLTPKNGEPCGECAICQEIANNQSVDIIEIDAASNRGIDEIRDLREKIAFAPARAKYKVYIIDEVHMLTKEAFNALLKTLEEPPSHALFILATTELHKVPETIISRCQRYQFHLASAEHLMKVLTEVAKQEKINLDPEAIQILAERADGSYRDALTLLGNVQGSDKLDAASLRQLIGLPPAETITTVLNQIQIGGAAALAKTLSQFINDGGDLAVLVRTLANQCRQQIFTDPAADLSTQARLLEELLVLLVKARHSLDTTSLLAAGLIGITANQQSAISLQLLPQTNPLADGRFQTVEKSENRAGGRQPIAESELPTADSISTKLDVNQPPVADSPISVADVTAPSPATPPAVDAVTATPVTPAEPGQFWPQFLEAVKEKNHALYAVVSSAKFEGLTDDKLIIAVKFRFYSERLFEPKNRNLIESLATTIADRPIILECLVKTDLSPVLSKDEDLLSTVVEVFEIAE